MSLWFKMEENKGQFALRSQKLNIIEQAQLWSIHEAKRAVQFEREDLKD